MSTKHNFINPSLELVHDKIQDIISQYVDTMSYSITTDHYQLGAERGYLVALRQFAKELVLIDSETSN